MRKTRERGGEGEREREKTEEDYESAKEAKSSTVTKVLDILPS